MGFLCTLRGTYMMGAQVADLNKYILDSGSCAVSVHPGCPWSGLWKDWIEEVRGLAYRTKVSFCCISSSDKSVIIGI